MEPSSFDVQEVYKLIEPVLGKKAWGVKIGYGSFLTIEFGNPTNDRSDINIHGEWHLWVCLCSWRIEKENTFLVGSGDKKERMLNVIENIEGSHLESFEMFYPSLDAKLTFDNGLILNLFSTIGNDADNDDNHWMFYTPLQKVIVAGPGSKILLENE